jgi:hypothetical protein
MLEPRSPSPYAARDFASRRDARLNTLRKALRITNSRLLGVLARTADYASSLIRKKHLPLEARALISLCQPVDPLRRKKALPAIELVIPFVEKDLEALPIVLAHARRNVRNPLARVVLITPRDASGKQPRFARKESPSRLRTLLAENPDALVLYDQDILGAPLLKEVELRFGRGDRNAGWVIQQLIKLSAAMQSESSASLILDSDTVLLSEKTWYVENRVQLLQVANEYHADFMKHVKSFFGVPKKLRLSFVTHHQLMQRDVVRQMFPEGSQSLLEWWKSSTDPIGRDLGDYEAYGSYLAHHFPERVAFGSFGNLFSPHLTKFLADLGSSGAPASELIPDYCSVSFHSWAQVDRAERGN